MQGTGIMLFVFFAAFVLNLLILKLFRRLKKLDETMISVLNFNGFPLSSLWKKFGTVAKKTTKKAT